ncbi:MAG: type II secretion system protein [Candidatus Portnoybacteria bacterium]
MKVDCGKKRGFTLIEMLVYISVLVIILASVLAFLSWLIKSNAKSRAMREVLENSQRAMEAIAFEIKSAKGVYTPTSAATQLSLETTNYLPSEEATTYIDFFLCDGASICLKKENQAPVILTSREVEINNLQFDLIGPATSSVRISFEASFMASSNKPEYQASLDFSSTVSLRPN